MSEFFQTGPALSNTYELDQLLQSYLRRKFPEAIHRALEPDWKRLGHRACTDILKWGADAESQPPRLITYDPWGKRVDEIEVSSGWKMLDRASAEEGLIATGYERKHGALSRLDQFARLYLFAPSSAFYSCPLAMTDGAARAIELYGDVSLKETAFRHLTSRDPAEFWTSGQWMTERTGGSDVSGTSTVARLEGGHYRLYGDKWFTSATTAQMAMTLARIDGAPEGSKGLSLFFVELRKAQGELQNIQVRRLKEKLGTKALPTAELTLTGTPAMLVGGEGGGVKKISSLFNITRIHNSLCSVANMQRGIALARNYASKRVAFGKPLSEHPLHCETLAWAETEFQAGFQLTFRAAELLGKVEMGEATPEENLVLRMLTPIAKLFTAKQSIAVASEVLEMFGGAGYIEDTGIPRLLRDAQVYAIWEGTTNVLSLDVLRAIEKEAALAPLLADARRILSGIRSLELQAATTRLQGALDQLQAYLEPASRLGPEFLQSAARAFTLSLGRVYAGALMLEHAEYVEKNGRTVGERASVHAAHRWCDHELTSLPTLDAGSKERLKAARNLALHE